MATKNSFFDTKIETSRDVLFTVKTNNAGEVLASVSDQDKARHSSKQVNITDHSLLGHLFENGTQEVAQTLG
jgi:hypothetical protein